MLAPVLESAKANGWRCLATGLWTDPYCCIGQQEHTDSEEYPLDPEKEYRRTLFMVLTSSFRSVSYFQKIKYRHQTWCSFGLNICFKVFHTVMSFSCTAPGLIAIFHPKILPLFWRMFMHLSIYTKTAQAVKQNQKRLFVSHICFREKHNCIRVRNDMRVSKQWLN